MLVYRLETRRGDGVFQSGLVKDAMEAVADERGEDLEECFGRDCFAVPEELQNQRTHVRNPCRHPSPWRDVPQWTNLGWSQRDEFFCAFKDRDQLLSWFDSEAVRAKMQDLGARLTTYEVDPSDVLQGRFQIMFRKAKATKVGRRTAIPLAA